MSTKILLAVMLTAFSVNCGQGNNNNTNNKDSAIVNNDGGSGTENRIQNSVLTLPLSSEFEHEIYYIPHEYLLHGEDWTCGEGEMLRYVPLPSKEDIQVILVPMDCGDFSYRFYLLTVKNNQITGNLYVEGEWFEPGDSQEDSVETTRFEISKNYIISVFTKLEGKETKKRYEIDKNGAIEEI